MSWNYIKKIFKTVNGQHKHAFFSFILEIMSVLRGITLLFVYKYLIKKKH